MNIPERINKKINEAFLEAAWSHFKESYFNQGAESYCSCRFCRGEIPKEEIITCESFKHKIINR